MKQYLAPEMFFLKCSRAANSLVLGVENVKACLLGDVCVGVLVSVNSERRSARHELVHQHAKAPPIHRLENVTVLNAPIDIRDRM